MKIKTPQQYQERMNRVEGSHLMSRPHGGKSSRRLTKNLRARYDSAGQQPSIIGPGTPADIDGTTLRSRRAERAIVAPSMDFRARFTNVFGIFGSDGTEPNLKRLYEV